MSSEIEIFVGDVNDVEGHVFARVNGVQANRNKARKLC